MTTVVRTVEQVEEMIKAIQQAMGSIPYDCEGRQRWSQLGQDITDLRKFLIDSTLPFDKWSNVRLWLTGNPNSTLDEYIGEEEAK